MPSPVAHALAGVAVYAGLAPGHAARGDRRAWALVLFAGVAADLDFLPGLLVGDPGRYHHGPTHALLAVALVALLAAPLAASRYGGPGRASALLGLAYASHLALDLVTVHQAVRPGIPIFWPFSGAYVLAPVQLFMDIHHGASWRAFVDWHNLAAILWEAGLVGGPVALLCRLRLREPARLGRAARLTTEAG